MSRQSSIYGISTFEQDLVSIIWHRESIELKSEGQSEKGEDVVIPKIFID